MTSLKLIKIIKYLLYLLALAPLIATPMTIFPFNFGRGLIIQFLIEIIAGLYLILAIYNKDYRPTKNWLVIFFGIYLIWLFITSFSGADFNKSFWSNEERFTGWFYLAHIYLIFIVLTSIFKKQDWKTFLIINISVALAMLAIAVLSLFGIKFWGLDLGKRISGTLGNPLFLATYFIINLIFSLYLFFNKGIWPRIFGGLSSTALIIGIFLTQSRGAFLGLTAGSAAALILFIFSNKKYRKIGISAIILLSLLLSAIFIFKNAEFIKTNGVLNRLSNISLSTVTAQTRLIGWQIAFRAFKERPILGWGIENYSTAFNKYYNPKLLRYSYYETWFDKPHNKIFETASDGGAIAIILYLSIFVGAFLSLRKKYKNGSIQLNLFCILTGGIIAYFTQNLFIFDTPVSYLSLIILLALISGLPFKEKDIEQNKLPIMAIIIGALVSLLAALLLNILPLIASIKLRQTTLLYEIGKKNNVEIYKKAIKIFNPYKEEWRVDLAKSIIADLQSKAEMYNKDEISYAVEELRKNATEHPNNAYYHLLLGVFYGELARDSQNYREMSIKELDRALYLSPNRQHIYFAYGRFFNIVNDRGKLVEVFKKAIELEPKASISYWEGGRQLYLFDEKDSLAKQWMIKSVEMGYLPPEDNSFIFIFKNFYKYFFENKKYSILVNLFGRMIPLEPNNVELRAQYATALYLAGEKVPAVKEIKKIMAMDESYKKEGEEFIRLIEADK